jgi:4-hydroxy-4-methyl-2-oxoglutarate aldolase
MAVMLRRPLARLLTDAELDRWVSIPTTIISDELNRSAGMDAGIISIGPKCRFIAEAVTVQVMVGDNLALHVAANRTNSGTVLIVSAGGYAKTAVWGEILHTAAQARGVRGVVIDGAVRDRAALSRSSIPVFARGACPNGPHKGWGGSINGSVQCGGVTVDPGDLVIGDEDGVAVVPRGQIPGLRERCMARIEMETNALEKIKSGASTVELFGIVGAVQEDFD